MFAYSTVKQNIINSLSKKIFWAFDVITGGGAYYWAMVTRSYGGQSYTFKIIPESFEGIRLNRGRNELNLQSPSILEFDILNPNNTLSASTFEGAELVVKLIISDYTNEAIIRQWRFVVKRVDPKIQKLHFYCEDYIQKYIYGDYPNTKLIKDLFPSEDTVSDDNVCIPEPYGTVYVPLRSVYISTFLNYTSTTISAKASSNGSRCRLEDVSSGLNIFEIGRNLTISGFTSTANNQVAIVLNKSATMLEFSESEGIVTEAAGDLITLTQGSRAYLLGSTHNTFTVSRVRSPREWGRKSEWYSSSYTMSQAIKINASSSKYITLQPIIHDVDSDGTADAPGLWRSGENFIDMPTRFSRSDTVNMTNPADIIKNVLENMGVSSTQLKNSTNLIAYWSFDDNSGTDVYDGSGNNNNLTLSASSLWSSTGKINTSVLLYSTNTYGNVVLSTYPSSQISFSCWVKFNSMSTRANPNTLLNYSFGSSGGFGLYASSYTLVFRVFYNSSDALISYRSTNIEDGSFHHIVGTYDGSISKIYIDSNIGTASSSHPIPLLDSTSLLYIGDNSANYLDGYIDEIRIYNKVLTSTEVEELYYNYKMEGWWETARNTYHQQGISFNGAFWFKEYRSKKLSKLLNMCHSMINSEDRIELLPIVNTSQKTIDNSDITTQGNEEDESTFDYNYIQEELSDCGYIAWQQSGASQDQFLQILVSAKGNITKISNEVLEIPFIQNDQIVQKLGSLYYQLKFLKKAEITFTGKTKLIGLKVGQFLTINHADYGGSYLVLIDSMLIKKDASIEFTSIKFSDTIDDFEDLSFGSITISEDDPDAMVWEPVIAGPLTEEDVGKAAFQIWGRPFLIVSPNKNKGDSTSIQSALNMLDSNKYQGIYILNGTYQENTIYFPDKAITIQGDNKSGVILKNVFGQDLFNLHNLTNPVNLSKFTIQSQNYDLLSYSYSNMIKVYGDSTTSNSCNLTIDDIDMDLVYNGSSGDIGINLSNNIGNIVIKNNYIIGGKNAINLENYNTKFLFFQNIIENSYESIRLYTTNIISNGIISHNTIKNFRYIGFHGTLCNNLNLSLNNLNTTTLAGSSVVENIGGIICDKSTRMNIISNIVNINTTSININYIFGIGFAFLSGHTICNNNEIKVNIRSTATITYGIGFRIHDGQICNNVVSVNNATSGVSQYGIIMASCGNRNVIQGNHIDMVNNRVNDIGIQLNTSANQNQGGDNITYNCGSGIVDSGSSNSITGKDI